MKINRRRFIATGVTAVAGFTASRLAAQSPAVEPPASGFQLTPEEIARGQKSTAGRKPRQNLDVVLAFVQAGHKTDVARLKEFIAYAPKLVIASWDWGNGDWETALGGASHTAHPEVARYLLSQGARMDVFCAAMLGEREAVKALLKADPATATTKVTARIRAPLPCRGQRGCRDRRGDRAVAAGRGEGLRPGPRRSEARCACGDDEVAARERGVRTHRRERFRCPAPPAISPAPRRSACRRS